MNQKKRWQISPPSPLDLIDQLLSLRFCQTAQEKEVFLDPPNPQTFLDDPGMAAILPEDLQATLELVQNSMARERPIVIHGDYDVDGICATTILWKTLYQDLNYKKCRPFIPNRFDHGYGLTKESINEILSSQLTTAAAGSRSGGTTNNSPLLITVDCGITSYDEVAYAKEKGLDVLILDHHSKPQKVPEAQILWTERLCATGLAWILSQSLLQDDLLKNLDLVALATIADLQSLTGPNRSLVKFGLEVLNVTKNVGLKQLFKFAGVGGRKLGTFEVGWILAPRLNASGRLEDALQSLRLLRTSDEGQAVEIAQKLNKVNASRQELTKQMVDLAIGQIQDSGFKKLDSKITIAVHEDFHEGVIGLVAGKLVQEYGTPAVVISRGAEFSKASARSVRAFNIVEFLRSLGDHFENVGGHAGAAGFTIRTSKIEEFIKAVGEKQSAINLPELLLEIDAEIKFEDLSFSLYEKISQLEPFGLGNHEPVFLLRGVRVVEARTVGAQGQHLKLKIQNSELRIKEGDRPGTTIDCIGFGMGRESSLAAGNLVDLVFTINPDDYSGPGRILLKIKDFKVSDAS